MTKIFQIILTFILALFFYVQVSAQSQKYYACYDGSQTLNRDDLCDTCRLTVRSNDGRRFTVRKFTLIVMCKGKRVAAYTYFTDYIPANNIAELKANRNCVFMLADITFKDGGKDKEAIPPNITKQD